jgi:uncharacterized protein
MSGKGPATASFEVTHSVEPAETLIAGFSTFGLAGLTAVDYLVNQLGMEATGFVTAAELPAITPFEDGRPRHHTRLFSRESLGLSVLVNELFVPVWAADSFAEAILEWTGAHGVEEVVILAGVPVPHGPEEHKVFYVATDDYRTSRLPNGSIPPMGGGFLDGINASLVQRGMDTDLKVCVYITPVHAQAPDVEAAIRLVEVVEMVYDIDIDVTELETFAGEVQEYYRDLAERVEATEPPIRPDDRMYM